MDYVIEEKLFLHMKDIIITYGESSFKQYSIEFEPRFIFFKMIFLRSTCLPYLERISKDLRFVFYTEWYSCLVRKNGGPSTEYFDRV